MTSNSTSAFVVPRSGVLGRPSKTDEVPRHATLDGFVADVSRPGNQGLRLPSLQPLTRLIVTTRNSTYHIVARGGAKVLVQGGRFFPQFTDAHLAGSGFGGSLLKLEWIAVGLRMELWFEGRPIVTSPVRSIAVEQELVAPSVS